MWEQRGGWAQHGASPSLWSALLWHQANTFAAVQKERHLRHTSCYHPIQEETKTQPRLPHLSSNITSYWVLDGFALTCSLFVHDSESVRKSTYTDGWGGGTMGGGRLWLVTTLLPSKWAQATGRMCVCVSTELPPAPPLHRRSVS